MEETKSIDSILSIMPHSLEHNFSGRKFLEQIERTKESFYKLMNSPSRIEELSCDLHACNIVQIMIENSNYSVKEICNIFKHCIDSLYYSELLNAVDECITGKIDMKTAENISFLIV